MSARALFVAVALALTAPASLGGCATAPDAVVTDQVLPVGCGTCQFKRTEGVGCYWAVELDGEFYPMAGELPPHHDNHAPDGMCNMTRQARLTGELRGGNFIASSFELLPAKGVPDEPKFTPEDDHGKDYRAE